MWTSTATATQEDIKPTIKKKIVNYYISKNTLSRFKQVCDNQQQTYSKVIENYMTRHCNK